MAKKQSFLKKSLTAATLIFALFTGIAAAEEAELMKLSPFLLTDTSNTPAAVSEEVSSDVIQLTVSPVITQPAETKPIEIPTFQSFTNPTRSSSFENTLFTSTLITSAALNAADYFTTIKALKMEGLKEANPFMKNIVKKPAVFAAVKIGITALNYVMLKKLHKKNKTLAWAVSLISNFALSYVVANNLHMINQASQVN